MFKEIKIGEVIVQVINLETNQVTSPMDEKYLKWKNGDIPSKPIKTKKKIKAN